MARLARWSRLKRHDLARRQAARQLHRATGDDFDLIRSRLFELTWCLDPVGVRVLGRQADQEGGQRVTELVCRRCGMVASLDMLRALLDERVHGCARCFCGGIEWDFKDGTVPTKDRIVQLEREVNG